MKTRVMHPLETWFLLVAICLSLTMAQAQTFQVIHTFTGGQDGAYPRAGLTMDETGNLYGTASAGGNGYGTVFELKHVGSGWTFHPLYSFAGAGNSDGAKPWARVVFGPDGALYGTTNGGGQGYGTVFKLQPAASARKTALCPWTETVLYSFSGGTDGLQPGYGDLVFDAGGNMYDTTISGGTNHGGVAYKVSPSGMESTLHSFGGNEHSGAPYGGLVFDAEGNLYGTALGGTYSGGPVGGIFELVPSGDGWSLHGLHIFFGGERPFQSLIINQVGALFGSYASSAYGSTGGAVYELSPFRLIETFNGSGGPIGGSLFMDAAGNLYGTTCGDGANQLGNVFKLSPSNGGWTYTSLYDFTGGNDGSCPYGTVSIDANGNLYGTASAGGSQGFGVVWEIKP